MRFSSEVLALPLVALLVLVGGLSAFTAWCGWVGRLPRNGRFGVRSPAAGASDAAFAVANRVAAPVVAGASLILLGCAAVLAFTSLAVLTVLIVFLVGAVGGVLLLVQAARLGDMAARRVPIPARRPGSGSCGGCACGEGGCSALRGRPAAAADVQ
jgi:hypothetical protein